jgi:hypothetical protein
MWSSPRRCSGSSSAADLTRLLDEFGRQVAAAPGPLSEREAELIAAEELAAFSITDHYVSDYPGDRSCGRSHRGTPDISRASPRRGLCGTPVRDQALSHRADPQTIPLGVAPGNSAGGRVDCTVRRYLRSGLDTGSPDSSPRSSSTRCVRVGGKARHSLRSGRLPRSPQWHQGRGLRDNHAVRRRLVCGNRARRRMRMKAPIGQCLSELPDDRNGRRSLQLRAFDSVRRSGRAGLLGS